jgi:hypothetical protein
VPGYAQPQHAEAAFDRSRQLFDQVAAGLAAPDCLALTHSEVEAQLAEQARELARLLLQAHLDLRADAEARREGVTDAGGVEHTRVEPGHQRALATVFGTVTVTRMAYRAPEAANLHPADAELNLPAGRHSHELSRMHLDRGRARVLRAGRRRGRARHRRQVWAIKKFPSRERLTVR